MLLFVCIEALNKLYPAKLQDGSMMNVKRVLNLLCAYAALFCVCGVLTVLFALAAEFMKAGYIVFWDGFTVAVTAFAILLMISIAFNIVIATMVIMNTGFVRQRQGVATVSGIAARSVTFVALICMLMLAISSAGEIALAKPAQSSDVLGQAATYMWSVFIISPMINLAYLAVKLFSD